MGLTREQIDSMTMDEIIAKALEDAKDLPRCERRRYEKTLKDHAKVAKTFNPAQQRFIDNLVEERSRFKTDKEMEKYNVMMDRCISAFLAIEYEHLSMDEIYAKEDFIAGLIVDDLKKNDKRLKESKGDLNMANKKIEKYEEQIRKICEELIKNGTSQKDSITVLQDKFPTLSKSMIINAYKKVKEHLKAVAEEVCIEQFENLEDEDIKEISKAAAEYIFEDEIEVKEEVKAPEVEKLEVVETKAPSKLRIKSMIVEGENGVYAVTPEGVEGDLGGGLITFTDIESLNKYKQAEIEKINKITDEFEAVFAMI